MGSPMIKSRFSGLLAALALCAPLAANAQPAAAQQGAAPAASPAPDDWTSWGYDQERTSWNRGETILSKKNVSHLKLKWTAQLSTAPTDAVLSTLTAPVIAEGVNTAQGSKSIAVVLGADDTIFALDADN